MNRYFTPAFLLFARPSFWTGFGQVLDFGNTMFEYNQSETGEQADYFAIRGDWVAIGQDFVEVMAEHPAEELANEAAAVA